MISNRKSFITQSSQGLSSNGHSRDARFVERLEQMWQRLIKAAQL